MSFKDEVLNYLKSRKLMSLATYSSSPWACVVYYVSDTKLNLYFISDPDSQHCRDIALNNKVSCAIFDSDQEVFDKKIGVQLWGIVTEIKGVGKLKWFFKMWAKINPGNKDILNFKNFKNKVFQSRVYRVSPKTIKFFNEKLYGEEGFKTVNL